MSKITAPKQEIIRGEILRILFEYFPEPVPLLLLQRQLDDSGFALLPEEVAFHLAYLSGKHYVHLEKQRGQRSKVEIRTAILTASGIDLVEGRGKTDRGVAV